MNEYISQTQRAYNMWWNSRKGFRAIIMNDYLTSLEEYKGFKDISDLIEETNELMEYYYTQQYEKMQQHINQLMRKYYVETFMWNKGKIYIPANAHEAFLNAEVFLKAKGQEILLRHGVKLQEEE